MVVMGAIVRNSDLVEIGTFTANENSIELDVDDKEIRAELKRNMGREWLSISDSKILGRGERLRERGRFAKPESVETLDNFFTMLDELGFSDSDTEVVEE